MPTIAGLRRRGYTPESIRTAVRARRHQQGRRLDRLREPRDRAARRPRRRRRRGRWRCSTRCASSSPTGPRSSAATSHREPCHAPVHPQQPELGTRDVRARPRALDRARRLRRGAGQGLLPSLPGQPRPPEVRLRRRVHRLREGRAGRGHARARDRRRRHEERHAGRRRGQGQGHAHLARRRRRARRPRCASTTGSSASRIPTPAARTSRRA